MSITYPQIIPYLYVGIGNSQPGLGDLGWWGFPSLLLDSMALLRVTAKMLGFNQMPTISSTPPTKDFGHGKMQQLEAAGNKPIRRKPTWMVSGSRSRTNFAASRGSLASLAQTSPDSKYPCMVFIARVHIENLGDGEPLLLPCNWGSSRSESTF